MISIFLLVLGFIYNNARIVWNRSHAVLRQSQTLNNFLLTPALGQPNVYPQLA